VEILDLNPNICKSLKNKLFLGQSFGAIVFEKKPLLLQDKRAERNQSGTTP
jgi:hypothetical protein